MMTFNDGLFVGTTLTSMLVSLWGLRFGTIIITRSLGLYSPDQYHAWFYLPWRMPYHAFRRVSQWYEHTFVIGKRGNTGGFASWLETFSLRYKPKMLHLGRATWMGIGMLQPVGIHLKKHAFMTASTGAGKTTALISMLSLWQNSVFIIDPKGQCTEALIKHDHRDWWVIDPYGMTEQECAGFNVFDCMVEAERLNGKDAVCLWADRIAYALISEPADSRNSYFYTVSRSFLSALILHVYTAHPKEEWNLITVRKLIIHGYAICDEDGEIVTPTEERHDVLISAMHMNESYAHAIAGGVTAMLKASGETGGNVWSTLSDCTRFLDYPALAKILTKSDIQLSDLKTKTDVVLSFVAPVTSIREEMAPFAKLLTNMTAYTFEMIKEKKGSCLFMIDELPSQNKNQVFLNILAVGRSQGILLLGISQNMGQMKRVYGKEWETFLSESDVVFWMATSHTETNDLLSKILGKKTYVQHGNQPDQKHYRTVDVMDAEQINRYLEANTNRLIVTMAGRRALKLRNDPYFKSLPVWKYAQDPEHGDTLLRKLTRLLLKV